MFFALHRRTTKYKSGFLVLSVVTWGFLIPLITLQWNSYTYISPEVGQEFSVRIYELSARNDHICNSIAITSTDSQIMQQKSRTVFNYDKHLSPVRTAWIVPFVGVKTVFTAVILWAGFCPLTPCNPDSLSLFEFGRTRKSFNILRWPPVSELHSCRTRTHQLHKVHWQSCS